MSTTLNFGCRLCLCESDAIITMTAGRADVIVNTCAVTAEAERIALPGPADRMRATVVADVQECVLTGAFDVGSLVRVRAATAVGLVA